MSVTFWCGILGVTITMPNFMSCHVLYMVVILHIRFAYQHTDTPYTSGSLLSTLSYSNYTSMSEMLVYITHRVTVWKWENVHIMELNMERRACTYAYLFYIIPISVYHCLLFIVLICPIFLQNAKYIDVVFYLKSFALIPKKIFCESLYVPSLRFCPVLMTHTRV